MKVIYEKLPSKRRKCVVAIGVFDGIHLGHQAILKKAKEESRKEGLYSLVITFDIPPQWFLRNYPPKNNSRPKKYFLGCLTDFQQKVVFIKSLDIDYLWFLKTSRDLLRLGAEEFISYIYRYFDVQKIIVGEDFRFGRAGEGDIRYLKKFSAKYGFKLIIMKKIKKAEKIISSSIVRKLISEGKIKEARKFLGRYFSLKGRVIKGKRLGRKLGFPTANVKVCNYVVPHEGVYASYAIIKNKAYLAAVNIGKQPRSLKPEEKLIEVHIINFGKNILGKVVEVIFLAKAREEKRISSIIKLKETIKKDIQQITAKYSIPPVKYPQLLVA